MLPGEDEATLQDTSIPRGGMLAPLGLGSMYSSKRAHSGQSPQPNRSRWPELEVLPDYEIAVLSGK